MVPLLHIYSQLYEYTSMYVPTCTYSKIKTNKIISVCEGMYLYSNSNAELFESKIYYKFIDSAQW